MSNPKITCNHPEPELKLGATACPKCGQSVWHDWSKGCDRCEGTCIHYQILKEIMKG